MPETLVCWCVQKDPGRTDWYITNRWSINSLMMVILYELYLIWVYADYGLISRYSDDLGLYNVIYTIFLKRITITISMGIPPLNRYSWGSQSPNQGTRSGGRKRRRRARQSRPCRRDVAAMPPLQWRWGDHGLFKRIKEFLSWKTT